MKIEINIKLVVGQMTYNDIETGYWSLKEEENNYRIINLPEELKKNNIKVAAIIKESESDVSIFMSGKPIELIEYKILK